jgi:hypothetical protein
MVPRTPETETIKRSSLMNAPFETTATIGQSG